jgi:nucleotide-binding universal stress UspA family protein
MKEVTREFERILVAVDGSPQSMRAVDVAISLAKKYDSVLTALYVIHIPFGETLYPRSLWHKDFINDIKKDTAGWIEEIHKRGRESGIEISSKMKETTESVPSEITKYAKEDKAGIIVVGSKGKSGMEKLFLGSVAAGVLAYAPCPVLVVR